MLFREAFPYEQPRPDQERATEAIVRGLARSPVVYEAPTGAGKSVVAYTAAKMTGIPTAYAVSTKNLQDQISADFPCSVLKGRNAYPCSIRVGSTCDDGECLDAGLSSFATCIASNTCPYNAAKRAATIDSMAVVNYNVLACVGSLDKQLLIADECHNLPDVMSDHLSMVVMDGMFGLDTSWLRTVPEGPDQDISSLLRNLESFYTGLKAANTVTSVGSTKRLIREALLKCGEMIKYLEDKEDAFEDAVVVQGSGHPREALIITPIDVSGFLRPWLSAFDTALFMSATVLNKSLFASMCGVDAAYVDSRYPWKDTVDNRLIFPRYCGSLSYANRDKVVREVVATVSKILEEHAAVRGIIHTHNMFFARAIYEGVGREARGRLSFQENLGGRELALRRHEHVSNSVLIAPAMHEGIDLKDDLSRFQVVVKVPFPPLNDALVKARNLHFPGYYEWRTACKLIQGLGRSYRGATDSCVSYVLDPAFDRFLSSYRYFPDWFSSAVRRC